MSKYKNAALERKIGVHFPTDGNPNRTQQFYPNEKYLEMIKGFAYESMESVSKVGCKIFKEFFERQPKEIQDKYLRSAKNYKGRK
jgi:hypothetical protein